LTAESRHLQDTDPLTARNSLCPCGSGRRFKHCCGRAADPSEGVTADPAAYKALMEEALRHQKDAEFQLAREFYTRALAIHPMDADALHMLGVVEYSLNEHAAAETHIRAAMQLAPAVPAIAHNLELVRAARATASLRRIVFDPEADRLPPPLADAPEIHVLQLFGNVAGGSEWHAVNLADRLRPHARVTLWTENPAAAEVFVRRHGVRFIDPRQQRFPSRGTLIIVGAYFTIGRWYEQTAFRRTIQVYNVVDPIRLNARLRQLDVDGAPRVELVYVSDAMRSASGLPGLFVPSPVDTSVFAPADPRGFDAPADTAPREPSSPQSEASVPEVHGNRPGHERAFTVGRLSRDDPTKFHPEAAAFYKALAADGFRVRLMGAMHLAPALGGIDRIELSPERAEAALAFLRSLDCFCYRTDPSWYEPSARVITEAMAVALPVVVHANGGYAQLIRHGENGFLFHRDEEAVRIIRMLRESPDRGRRIGRAARATVESLCSETGFRRFADFYLR
jgi:glycosyltransferase involved in cell wall biosynthesis